MDFITNDVNWTILTDGFIEKPDLIMLSKAKHLQK